MDDDMETCSWCTEEVPDSSLKEAHDGARLCEDCRKNNPEAMFSDRTLMVVVKDPFHPDAERQRARAEIARRRA